MVALDLSTSLDFGTSSKDKLVSGLVFLLISIVVFCSTIFVNRHLFTLCLTDIGFFEGRESRSHSQLPNKEQDFHDFREEEDDNMASAASIE